MVAFCFHVRSVVSAHRNGIPKNADAGGIKNAKLKRKRRNGIYAWLGKSCPGIGALPGKSPPGVSLYRDGRPCATARAKPFQGVKKCDFPLLRFSAWSAGKVPIPPLRPSRPLREASGLMIQTRKKLRPHAKAAECGMERRRFRGREHSGAWWHFWVVEKTQHTTRYGRRKRATASARERDVELFVDVTDVGVFTGVYKPMAQVIGDFLWSDGLGRGGAGRLPRAARVSRRGRRLRTAGETR